MHSIFQEKNHVPCCHIQSFFVRLLSPCSGGFCNVKNARELQNRMVKLLHREYSIEYFFIYFVFCSANPQPAPSTTNPFWDFLFYFIIYYLLFIIIIFNGSYTFKMWFSWKWCFSFFYFMRYNHFYIISKSQTWNDKLASTYSKIKINLFNENENKKNI